MRSRRLPVGVGEGVGDGLGVGLGVADGDEMPGVELLDRPTPHAARTRAPMPLTTLDRKRRRLISAVSRVMLPKRIGPSDDALRVL
jgi:hypothetical protein